MINRPHNVLWILTIVSLAAAAVGCSTTSQPGRDPEFASVRPVDTQPLPIDTGAIYKSGYGIKLFEDNKANKIGDILTVVLAEKTNASKQAHTKTTKDSDVKIDAPLVLGKGITRNGVALLQTDLAAALPFSSPWPNITAIPKNRPSTSSLP